MSKVKLGVHYNLDKLREEEGQRLLSEIFLKLGDDIEMGADSNMFDFFEGDVFAMAKHLGIEVTPPFDEMENDTGNGFSFKIARYIVKKVPGDEERVLFRNRDPIPFQQEKESLDQKNDKALKVETDYEDWDPSF